jgi:hypothetical protein
VSLLLVAANFVDLLAPAERLTASRLLCGRLYHTNDRLWLRYKNSVACVHCGDLGARTLIHLALERGAYDMILCGQDGVGGLASPCSHGDGRFKSFLGELLLTRQELSVRCRDIG